MRLSIVLPIFNEEEFLGRCLDSMMMQDRCPDEILCVVDCRTRDRSEDICRKYPVRLLHAGPGKLNARDLGINLARGDVIVAIDADRYYPPTFLSDIESVLSDNRCIAARGWTKFVGGIHGILNQYFRDRISGGSSAFYKWAYHAVGGFDLTIDQHDHRAMVEEEEIQFLRRLKTIGKIGNIKTYSRHLRNNPLKSRIRKS